MIGASFDNGKAGPHYRCIDFMRRSTLRVIVPLCIAACTLTLSTGRADEGFWLFNAPPLKQLDQKYHYAPDAAWLEHIQKSSVRFNELGSGAFVSENGLVITNHHVGADTLQKLGDAQHNYIRDGFYAASPAEEKQCYDLELNVLESIEDVTDRVNTAVPADAQPEQALAARRKAIAEIEQESKKMTGLRSDVIAFSQGLSYQLYRYKQYTDVRLVFAPETGIANFGGDPDDFEYPRYALDICLFRVYENNQPVHPQHYLRFNGDGPAEHDLVFASGNAARTNRSRTLATLQERRDVFLPARLAALYRSEAMLNAFSERSIENARRAREQLLRVRNARKAFDGELAALLDPETFRQISERENALKLAAATDPRFTNLVESYQQIEKAVSADPGNVVKYLFFEATHPRSGVFEGLQAKPIGFESELFRLARGFVRAAEEWQKPNEQRLPEYRDVNLPALEMALFSEAPIYDDLEIAQLADSLTALVGQYGVDDPVVGKLLQGKSPRDRARELITGTKLKNLQFRHQLYDGGITTLKETTDPMIDFAKTADEPARRARQLIEQQDEVANKAYAQIAAAKLAIEGDRFTPDATFTLRLSYGVVEGYEEDGKKEPAFTDFGGLYQRAEQHENRPPFELPARWLEKRATVDPHSPLDFVSTIDCVGGSSGSPIVNRNGEFVGVVFDGNIQTLAWDYLYSDKQGRTISVDSKGILEALKNVYQVPALVNELVGKK
jgi:hypothetical protein